MECEFKENLRREKEGESARNTGNQDASLCTHSSLLFFSFFALFPFFFIFGRESSSAYIIILCWWFQENSEDSYHNMLILIDTKSLARISFQHTHTRVPHRYWLWNFRSIDNSGYEMRTKKLVCVKWALLCYCLRSRSCSAFFSRNIVLLYKYARCSHFPPLKPESENTEYHK